MALPAFLDRTLDALSGLPVAQERDWFRKRLQRASLMLTAAPGVADQPTHRAGYLLSVNLASRLYPRLWLDAPSELCDAAEDLVRRINPDADVVRGESRSGPALLYGMPTRGPGKVGVSAAGWRVDLHPAEAILRRAAGPAALAAATIGSAELFRRLIRDALPPQKRRPSPPVAFNLLDWSEAIHENVVPSDPIDLGRAHLVGAGAVGEAAALALSTVPLSGEFVPVDHEPVTLANLQRYVLATADDVGMAKTTLVARHFAGSALRVTEVPTPWGADERSGPGATVALVALDTARGRIEVAASLPNRAYNAFTGPNDLGWSRHERFGQAPCLACMYWPTGPVPNRHEVIAAALGIHPERALLYLIRPTHPVGLPALPSTTGQLSASADDLRRWTEQSLLDDLVERLVMLPADAERWRGETLESLYRDGYCGGAFVAGNQAGQRDSEVVVPLAMQSVFAGIMLATQAVVAADPRLIVLRQESIEARIDLVAPFPQIVWRPRLRARGCICSDPDYGGQPF